MTHKHCPTIDRSKCSEEENICEACEDGSTECQHLENTPICLGRKCTCENGPLKCPLLKTTPHCKEGKCVACLDDDHCGEGRFCKNDGTCGGCENNIQCTNPETSWCQVKTGLCKKCNKDEECIRFDNTPVCAHNQGCKECTEKREDRCKRTGSGKPYCWGETFECQVCRTHQNCKDLNDALPYCMETRDPVTKKKIQDCVACLDSADCQDPTLPFCNDRGTCSVGCAQLEHPFTCEWRSNQGQFVGGKHQNLICHIGSGECRECEKKDHCKGKKLQLNNAFACNPVTSTCVQCTEKEDCNQYKETNTIGAAATNAFACNTHTNLCVQCMVDADCQRHKSNWKTCNVATHRCGE